MKYIKQKEAIFFSIFILFFTIIFKVNNTTIFFDLVNPIAWIGIIIYVYFIYKNTYIRNSHNNRNIIMKMLIITIVYLLIYFYIGFYVGFSKNLYSIQFIDILKNIFKVIIPIIGIECLRGLIVSRNKNNKKIILVSIIIFILMFLALMNLIRKMRELPHLDSIQRRTVILILRKKLIYPDLNLVL